MMRQMNPESLKGMASLLQQYGRNGDTMLAHINPREAMLLDRVSGGGSMNPMTGMPEFFNGDDDTDGGDAGGAVGGEDNPGGESGDTDGGDAGGAVGSEDNPGGESGGGFAGDAEDDAGYDEFDVSTIDFGLFGPAAGPEGLANLGADGPADTTGLAFGDTRTAASMGLGSLAGQMMPDSPGIMEILTAPIESLVNFFTMVAVDLELTGKDVFGVPGMTSTDLSRGMRGLQGPQPVGVEIGFSPIGTVSIDKSGVNAYAGPITKFLNEAFSSDFAKNPDNKEVTQAAAEKVQEAKEIAMQQKEAALPTSDRGPITGYARRQDMPLSLTPSFKDVTTAYTSTDLDPSKRTDFLISSVAPEDRVSQAPSSNNVGPNLDRGPVGVPLGVNPVGVNLNRGPVGVPLGVNPVGVNLNRGPVGVPLGVNPVGPNLDRFAKGGAVSLDALYNNVRARRGPITGGQRSGSGIMSLR